MRDAASRPRRRTLLGGIAFGESPRWHAGRLWFADWATRELIAVEPGGASQVVMRVPSLRGPEPAGLQGPFCFDWLPDGRLLVVSGREGLLLVGQPDGSLATHADLAGLARHPWNEIAVDGRGNAFLNDIGFDFPGGEFAPGLVAVVRPDGSLGRVAEGVAFPNGMAVTPDDATLILAESWGRRLTAFDIGADGSLSNRRVWADLGDGAPDGICLDAEGAVWYADVPHRRCVRVREGGAVLDVLEFDRGCFACMLGGADGRTLFVLAAEWRGPERAGGGRTGQLLAVRAPAPGAGHP